MSAAVRDPPYPSAAVRRSVLGVASLAGLMMLAWPLLLRVQPTERVDPPFLFLALLPS